MRLCVTLQRGLTWWWHIFVWVKSVASSFRQESCCTNYWGQSLSATTTDLSIQKKQKAKHYLQDAQHSLRRVLKSNWHYSHTYIILIWGWSLVFRTIQLHSHRQPEHPGDSTVEVILVCEGARQVVCIWSWDASLRVTGSPGSLLKRMTFKCSCWY